MDKKISLPETIFIMLYIGFFDLIGFLLIFVGLDDFWIIDVLTSPITQFYFRMKGVGAGVDLAASILELIPYLGALPIKSIGVALTIYLANHPKILGAASQIAGMAKGETMK